MKSGVQVIGIDDGPFDRDGRGDVLAVGAVFRGGERLEGILSTKVRRDGRNATSRLVEMVGPSRFLPQLNYVILDGIALAGFNVVDLPLLSAELKLPVMAVTRHRPNRDAVREALLKHLPGGKARWAIIERAGPVLEVEGLFCQLVGMDDREAGALIRHTRCHAKLPEPIRVAHLVAAGVVKGASRGRP